jgi:rRNA maturation endonuclease Nob1
MRTCDNCGAEAYRVESRFCSKCGAMITDHAAPRQNLCTNPYCEWHKSKFIYPDDAHYCDVCGSKTVYAE